jgi:hypothetical protein
VRSVSRNELGEEGAVVLAGLLCNTVELRSLSCFSNAIGSRGAGALSEVLPRLTALQQLM